MGLAISSVSFWTLIAAIFTALSKPVYPKLIHSCSKCGSAGFCWTKPRLRSRAIDGSTAIAVSDVSAANHVQSISATYTDVIKVLINPSNYAVAADAISDAITLHQGDGLPGGIRSHSGCTYRTRTRLLASGRYTTGGAYVWYVTRPGRRRIGVHAGQRTPSQSC